MSFRSWSHVYKIHVSNRQKQKYKQNRCRILQLVEVSHHTCNTCITILFESKWDQSLWYLFLLCLSVGNGNQKVVTDYFFIERRKVILWFFHLSIGSRNNFNIVDTVCDFVVQVQLILFCFSFMIIYNYMSVFCYN